MAANVTPTPASVALIVPRTSDSTVFVREQVWPTATTAFVASVNQTGEALYGRPIILTVAYSNANIVSNTVTTNGATITVSKVIYSTPVVTASYTQYHQIVPTNTTVWNSLNSPSSLLLAAKGSGDDVVSYTWSVVSDTTH